MVLNKITKIIIAALVAIIGFLAGNYSIDKASIEKKGYATGYNSAWDKATKLVDSIKTPIMPQTDLQSMEMRSISAKIKNVSASDFSLTVEAYPVSSNPLSEDSKSTTREIKINTDTKIVKLTSKTPKEIQEEISKKSKETSAPIAPFSPFSEKEITFDQLKADDMIIISSDKDIKKETKIAAVKIAVQ